MHWRREECNNNIKSFDNCIQVERNFKHICGRFLFSDDFVKLSLSLPFPLSYDDVCILLGSLINYGWGFSAGVLLNQTVARRPRSGHTTLCVILCHQKTKTISRSYNIVCDPLPTHHPKTKTKRKTICLLYNIVSDPLSTHRLLETKDVAGWCRDDLKIYWPSQPAWHNLLHICILSKISFY